MTRKGSGRAYVRFSTVTWRSLIPSSRALCALGLLRLISSARTMLANRGPGENVKFRLSASKMWTPRTSCGRRSLVNCTRRNVPEMLAAMARASGVFPVPGKGEAMRKIPGRNDRPLETSEEADLFRVAFPEDWERMRSVARGEETADAARKARWEATVEIVRRALSAPPSLPAPFPSGAEGFG